MTILCLSWYLGAVTTDTYRIGSCEIAWRFLSFIPFNHERAIRKVGRDSQDTLHFVLPYCTILVIFLFECTGSTGVGTRNNTIHRNLRARFWEDPNAVIAYGPGTWQALRILTKSCRNSFRDSVTIIISSVRLQHRNFDLHPRCYASNIYRS